MVTITETMSFAGKDVSVTKKVGAAVVEDAQSPVEDGAPPASLTPSEGSGRSYAPRSAA